MNSLRGKDLAILAIYILCEDDEACPRGLVLFRCGIWIKNVGLVASMKIFSWYFHGPIMGLS